MMDSSVEMALIALRTMAFQEEAFDDFVDDCLLDEDNLCQKSDKTLDLVIKELISYEKTEISIAA